MVLVSGSENTRATRAGARASFANRSGSGDHGTMSMRSPFSSFTTACTREPFIPTHAPTGSIESSRDETAILVRLPASRAVARISTICCWISGTSSLNRALTKSGSARDRMSRGPLGVSSIRFSTARIVSPWWKCSRWFCSRYGMIASASRNFASMTTILPRSICCTSPDKSSPTLSENSSRMRARSPSRTRWMMRCFAACTAVRPNASNGTSSSSTSPTWKSASSKRASSSATWVPGSSTVSTTVRSTAMRIVPLSSSIPISARTFGPYRFTRAACSPSLSRSSSSVRSSCLVLVSSRIAETTSLVFVVMGSSSPIHRQTRVANSGQRHRPRRSPLGLEHDRRLVGNGHDTRPHAPEPRHRRLDLAAHEPHPMPMPAHGSFEPRARHLEHVAASQRTVRVEPRLERPARRPTIVHRHTSRRLAGRPFDAHLNERPVLRAADAEVGQFEAQRVQAGPKRLDEAVGEHKKKRGPNLVRFTGRNLAAGRRLSSEWQPCVGDHAPVAPTRGAVREEVLAVVRAAPGGDGDLSEAEGLGLPRQRGPEVHVSGPGLGASREPTEHFRTYFIALTTNAYSTMHYDIARSHKRHPLQDLHAALQDARRRPPPPGVQQRDYVLLGHREVDRDAVGDGDRQQKPPSSGRVPVHPVHDQPPIAG